MTPPLTLDELCAHLKKTRRTLYRQLPQLMSEGVVQEVLPRIGHRRFLAGPVEDYVTGRTLHERRRQELRRTR